MDTQHYPGSLTVAGYIKTIDIAGPPRSFVATRERSPCDVCLDPIGVLAYTGVCTNHPRIFVCHARHAFPATAGTFEAFEDRGVGIDYHEIIECPFCEPGCDACCEEDGIAEVARMAQGFFSTAKAWTIADRLNRILNYRWITDSEMAAMKPESRRYYAQWYNRWLWTGGDE